MLRVCCGASAEDGGGSRVCEARHWPAEAQRCGLQVDDGIIIVSGAAWQWALSFVTSAVSSSEVSSSFVRGAALLPFDSESAQPVTVRKREGGILLRCCAAKWRACESCATEDGVITGARV